MMDASGKSSAPLVSIVMPTFNRADLILDSIRSVIDQSFGDWELIVIDDGSTDDTVARIESLAEPRIVIIRHPHIGNVATLRNCGARVARGEFLAFLDSDDLWLPSKLQRQLRSLSGTSATWSYGAHALVDRTGKSMPLRAGTFRPVSGRIIRQLLTEETGASVITWLVPKQLFEMLGGFDQQMSLREDLDLALRLACAADAIAVPEVIALAREHLGRRTRNVHEQHRLTARVFKQAVARLDDLQLRRLAQFRYAAHLAHAGRALLAKGRLLAGMRLIGQALLNGARPHTLLRAASAGLWHAIRVNR